MMEKDTFQYSFLPLFRLLADTFDMHKYIYVKISLLLPININEVVTN